MHAVHVGAEPVEYEPAKQRLQMVAPDGEYMPAPQLLQDTAPLPE